MTRLEVCVRCKRRLVIRRRRANAAIVFDGRTYPT
jgi:hypothetical protein